MQFYMKYNHHDNIRDSIGEAITENIRVQKVIVDQVIQGIDDAIEYNYELRRIAEDYVTTVNKPNHLDLRKEQGLVQKPNQKMETVLRYMPVRYRAKRWNNKEIHELHENVAKYILEKVLERKSKSFYAIHDMNSNRTQSIAPSSETISHTVASIKSNPYFLVRSVNGFREADWERISNFGLLDRSGADCRVMWCSTTDFISCGKWSHHKLKELIYLAVKNYGAFWAKIAQELCDNRRPIFCLQMWQKIIKSFIPDVKTTVTRDQKEFASSSAVENRSKQRSISVQKHKVYQKFALRRRPWSVSEDIDLQRAVAIMIVLQGKVSWTEVSCHVHNRSAVQCRDRWASSPNPRPH